MIYIKIKFSIYILPQNLLVLIKVNSIKLKSNHSTFDCLKSSCKKLYNSKKLNDKFEIVNSCLIWLKRTKSSIKVFEDTLVLVINCQMAPT